MSSVRLLRSDRARAQRLVRWRAHDEQQALVLAVVDALNKATRPVTDEQLARFLGEPLKDVAAVRRILELPNVVFQPGELPKIVLARILDVLKAFDEGEDYTPPAGRSRYR